MTARFQGITIVHNGNSNMAEERSAELTSKKYEMSLTAQDRNTGAFYNFTEGDVVDLMKETLGVTVDPDLCKATPAEAKASEPLMARIEETFRLIMAEVQKIGSAVFQNKVAGYVKNRKDNHNNTDVQGNEIQEEFATIAGLITIKKPLEPKPPA
jgi:hypothetical protein